MVRFAASALIFALLLGSTAGASVSTTKPLLGSMYSHFDCDLNVPNTGIVAILDNRHARWLLRAQLAAMRQARLDTLRIIVWNQSNPSGLTWGVVRSAGGKISEPAGRT